MNHSFAMHVASHGHRARDPASARDALTPFLAGLADAWRAWTRYRELRAMSDARLARLGITRGDLAHHAVFSATTGGR